MCTIEDSDASAPVDAGPACVYIDPATYDQSCKQDSDCIEITPGRICSGDCACGGAAVNSDGEARFDAAINSLVLAACPCVSNARPRCVQGTCTQCGIGTGLPPGCPDGG
jgi:hypothetical protein